MALHTRKDTMSTSHAVRYETVTIPCHTDTVRAALLPRDALKLRRHSCSTCGRPWTLAVASREPEDLIDPADGSRSTLLGGQVFLREGTPGHEPTLDELRTDPRWYHEDDPFDRGRLLDDLARRRRAENGWHREAVREKARLLRCSNCWHQSDPSARGWIARLDPIDGTVVLCPICLAEENATLAEARLSGDVR